MSAVTDLTAALPIPEGGIVSKAILDLPGATKVVLFALDAGQEISPHAAPFPAELVALEGRIRVSVGEEARVLLAHQAVDLPPGVPHGIVAQEPSRFMLTMRRGAKALAAAPATKEEACAHHGCDHGSLPAAAGQVSNPTLLKWMAEHAEALKRLDRMEGAVKSGDWDGVKDVATWLFEELKAHNEAEEQHLFPLLDPMFGGGHGPTHCMREEHRLLWDLTQIVLGDIREGVSGNPEGTARASTQLIGTLRSHIEKENNVLYPMAERMLDAATLARLGEVFAHA
ncbi:MAG: hemerythrin domain-containing protein [Holophagaceae bacterium]